MQFVVILAALVTACMAIEINYYDCGHREVEHVRVIGCEHEPCSLTPGEEFIFELKFAPRKSAEKVKLVLFVDILGFQVNLYTIDNFCGYYGFKCPLVAGESHVLKVKQHISKYVLLPSVSTILGLKLMTGNKSGVVACAVFKLALRGKKDILSKEEL